GLQLPDEVPRDRLPGGGDRGRLGRRLLVAVLPEVGQPKASQRQHVGGGIRLGDRDERDLGGIAPRRRARRGDPVSCGRQVARKLGSPAHLRKSGTSRSSSSSKT